MPGTKILHPDTGTPLADSSLKSHSQSTAAQNAVMFFKVGLSARDGACCWDLLARAWLYFSGGYSYYSLRCKYGALLIPSIVSPSSNSRTSQSRGCSWTYPPGTGLNSFPSFSSLCKSTCSAIVPFQPGSPVLGACGAPGARKLAPIRAVSPRASLRTRNFLLWLRCLELGVMSFSTSPHP